MDIAGPQRHTDLEEQRIYDGTRISTTGRSAPAASNNPAPPQDAPVQVPRTDIPRIIITKIQISDVATAIAFLKPLDAKKNNWETWSVTILLALELVKATGIVDGKTPKPNPDTDLEAADNWNYNDVYIKMLIRTHVADSELMHIRSSQTSHHMWDALKKLHQLMTYQIFTDKLRVFQEIKAKNGDNIPDHLMKLKKQWEEVQYFLFRR